MKLDESFWSQWQRPPQERVSSTGTYSTTQGGASDVETNGSQKKQMRGERRHTVDGAQIEQALMSKEDENLVRQRDAFFDHLAKKYPEHAQKITTGGHNTGSLPRQHYTSQQYPRQQSSAMSDGRYSTLPARPGSADVYRRNTPTTQSFAPQRRQPGPVYESDVDDPGIMSEAETSATGFYRGGKYRASLPVRSPTRPPPNVGGLVFLVYRGQTRRALLPNEVTHLDTIKALFVRSFPDKLTMQFLNSPWRKIYLLDQNTKTYHQLQDTRQVHDRCVLHLYEEEGGAPMQPSYLPSNMTTSVHETNVDDVDNYFSEPELEMARRNRNVIGRSASYHANTELTRQVRPGSLPLSSSYVPLSQQPAVTPPSAEPADHYIPVYDSDGIRSGASTPDPETRNRMARMEAQIANLTAWVQSSRSRSASESDRGSEGSYTPQSSMNFDRRYSGISDGSGSTPQPTVSIEVQEKIQAVHQQTKELKNEYKNLKRIHQAQAETMRETIRDTFNQIIGMLQQVPGADDHPVRSQRQKANVKLGDYKQNVQKLNKDLNDLEDSVEELRGDVINRRCRVNMDEVESMALALSKITKTLAEQKAQFPKVSQDLKKVLTGEVEIVIRQEKYLKEEPDRLEDSLKKCKKLTGTLFTLKRLASVQEHRPVAVPDIHTSSSPDEQEKKSVLENIQALVPDHEDRQQKIRDAELARERKKKLVVNKETLKFEKSLEMASKSLKQAENLPKVTTGNEPLVTKSEDGVHTYQGQIMNQDTGKSQDRKDDIMFIDEDDEISMQMDAVHPSAFTPVTSSCAVTIPSSTITMPTTPVRSLPPPTSMTQTVVETQRVKSHVSQSESPVKQSRIVRYKTSPPAESRYAPVQPIGSLIKQTALPVPVGTLPAKQSSPTKMSAGSPTKGTALPIPVSSSPNRPLAGSPVKVTVNTPTKKSVVHMQLSTSNPPTPPRTSSRQIYTSHVDLIPTREEKTVQNQISVAKSQSSQQILKQTSLRTTAARSSSSSIPVSMTTTKVSNVSPQKPKPRKVSWYEQDLMQGVYSNLNRPDLQDQKSSPVEVLSNPENIRSFQDLPEHLSSEDSDTDSVNSQDSQEGVASANVPKSKTTDELSFGRSYPPPPMPRSSSLSRAQIIQHTNQMRKKKKVPTATLR